VLDSLRVQAHDGNVSQHKDNEESEPVYELIGEEAAISQSDHGLGQGDRRNAAPGVPGAAAVALRLALHDCWASVRSLRFWLQALAVFLVSWACAVLLVIALVTGGAYTPDAQFWAYILTAALLVLAASVVAFLWGLSGPGTADVDGGVGLLHAWFFAAARGLVFTAASMVGLLVLASAFNAPAELAGVAAVVMIFESFVFAGIAAGAAWWLPGRGGLVLAWSMTGFLLFGNVAAVIALLPSVRQYEPARVVINVHRDDLGRIASYECSPEFSGIVEVFHTERIIWLGVSHPLLMFALFAGETSPGSASLGWLPAELEAAAAGNQIPCVGSATAGTHESGETGAQVPLALAGIGTQIAVAGTLLLAGNAASRRRGWLLSP
jgi:hypothetical protein